jgi:predicted regulator of amino acid metabolism with ACT domain
MPSRIDRLKSDLAARTGVERRLIYESVRRTIGRPARLRRLAKMIGPIH